MWELIRNQPTALLLAVVVHALVLLGLVFNYQVNRPPQPVASVPAIQAVVMQALPEEQPAPVEQVAPVVSAPEPAPQVEQKDTAEERRQQEAEHQRMLAREAELKAEQVRKQAEQAERQVAEQKRLADEAAKRKAEDEQRRVVAERKKAEEARKRDEEERRRAAEAELRAQLDEEERQQAEAEQRRLVAARAQRIRGEADRYTQRIVQKIEGKWERPEGAKAAPTCVARVRLMPGGGVVDVHVVKSCGNGLVDASLEAAVRKASPLPVPSDPDVFNELRDLNLVFHPK